MRRARDLGEEQHISHPALYDRGSPGSTCLDRLVVQCVECVALKSFPGVRAWHIGLLGTSRRRVKPGRSFLSHNFENLTFRPSPHTLALAAACRHRPRRPRSDNSTRTGRRFTWLYCWCWTMCKKKEMEHRTCCVLPLYFCSPFAVYLLRPHMTSTISSRRERRTEKDGEKIRGLWRWK